MYKLGIDLGGSKIEGVILDASHKQLFRERVPTEQEGGYRQIRENLRTLYHNMRRHIADDPHTFGIGTPGAISPRTGLLRNSNTLCLNNMPLKADLENLLGHPIAIQNDANCFAMAEAIDGAGKENDLVFGVIMGTGCGGGIVFNGALLTGRNAVSGEWGPTPLPWMRPREQPGPNCACGLPGCIETFVSGTGFSARHAAATGARLDAAEIARRAAAGDDACAESLARYEDQLARALAGIINVIDPDIIVLGGGMSNVQRLYVNVPKLWSKWVFSDRVDTRLAPPMHGDSSGVRGAAWLWPEKGEAA